jgi:hypothetical protein
MPKFYIKAQEEEKEEELFLSTCMPPLYDYYGIWTTHLGR